MDIVNNCHQELRLKNWQHIRILPWQGIKYSFRSKAKVYHTLRNLVEGGGIEKLPSSPNWSRSSWRSGSRQIAVCITCFLQEPESCTILKCVHLIKELNARNLYCKHYWCFPIITCEAKTFEFIRYNLQQLLFWWILFPKTINSLSHLWSNFLTPFISTTPIYILAVKYHLLLFNNHTQN